MDLILLAGVAISFLLLIITLIFLRKKDDKVEEQPRRRPAPIRIQPDIHGSRALIARNQRNRARQAASDRAQQQQATAAAAAGGGGAATDDSDVDDIPAAPIDLSSAKIGTKKRAKLEAKAEKKAQREVELQIREDKKKKEAIAEEERKKIEDKEKDEDLKREEAERMARELKEKQEYEEYLKMKEAFSVEEEGFDENDDDENRNFLREFVEYIKNNKVVVLEELAKEFKLKTQAVIDRIHELKTDGTLTGVIDDRGKFIYISEEELSSVAKFIRQRGRISIIELVESSNDLINLSPVTV